jgi:hypothetical protein
MPAEPTDPIRLGPTAGDGINRGGASERPIAEPTGQVGSLRVVDPPTSPGLVESIVGNVTGFFFGG